MKVLYGRFDPITGALLETAAELPEDRRRPAAVGRYVWELPVDGTLSVARWAGERQGFYLEGKVYWKTPPVRTISAAMASAWSMNLRSMALI